MNEVHNVVSNLAASWTVPSKDIEPFVVQNASSGQLYSKSALFILEDKIALLECRLNDLELILLKHNVAPLIKHRKLYEK